MSETGEGEPGTAIWVLLIAIQLSPLFYKQDHALENSHTSSVTNPAIRIVQNQRLFQRSMSTNVDEIIAVIANLAGL